MVRSKNIKKKQPPVDPVEAHVEDEEAHDAASPAAAPSSPSSGDEGPSNAPIVSPQKKKKYRPTHSEIKDYYFKEEQVQMILDFLKDNPCLYNKKDREYHNNILKVDLWRKCAKMFPDCTYLQVRKFFEKKRTAFGKIENNEMKSGAGVRPRTAREEEIMRHWGFFKGHIAHGPTLSTQTFGYPAADESSSTSTDATDMSAISAASIQRRKNLKKCRLQESDTNPEPAPAPSPPPAPAPSSAAVHVNPGEKFIERMFEKASAMMQQPVPSTSSQNNLDSFARLIVQDMQDLNVEVLTVVKKYKAKRRQQTAQEKQQEQQPIQPIQQEQQPIQHPLPQQQQQQLIQFQPPQPPRPQTPCAWLPRPPSVPPITVQYQQQSLTQPQYLPPSTFGTFGPSTTYQQHQYVPQHQQTSLYSYSNAPSSSGAQTTSSPAKSTVSPDSRISITPILRDLDIPICNISSILNTSDSSLLNTPQKDPDEPRTPRTTT